MIKRIISNIVITVLLSAISVAASAKEFYSCTGFFVNSIGTIITAKHCVKDASKIVVYVAGQPKPFEAHILNYNINADVGVLSINYNSPLFFKLALNTHDGDRVETIGFPDPELLGLNIKAEYGIVAKILPNYEDDFILTSHAGASGSPIINANGDVVGVLVAAYNFPNVSGSQDTIGMSSASVRDVLLLNGILPVINNDPSLVDFDSYVLFKENKDKVVFILGEIDN